MNRTVLQFTWPLETDSTLYNDAAGDRAANSYNAPIITQNVRGRSQGHAGAPSFTSMPYSELLVPLTAIGKL